MNFLEAAAKHDRVVDKIYYMTLRRHIKIQRYGYERKFRRSDKENLRRDLYNENSLMIRTRPDLFISSPEKYFVEVKTTFNINLNGVRMNSKREYETIYVIWNGERKTQHVCFFLSQLKPNMISRIITNSFLTVENSGLYNFRWVLDQIELIGAAKTPLLTKH